MFPRSFFFLFGVSRVMSNHDHFYIDQKKLVALQGVDLHFLPQP